MKIFIGITHNPSLINQYIERHHGQSESLTEVGPFSSRLEALNWLVYLKSRIGTFEEIIPRMQTEKNTVWYGFTFEQLR